MKNFWHIIAAINTLAFVMLVIGLYLGCFHFNHDTSVSGLVDINVRP